MTRRERSSQSGFSRSAIATAGLFAALVGLLQGLASSGLVSTFLLPSPLQIAARFPGLFIEEDLLARFARTGLAVIATVALATLIGGLVGWGLYRSPNAWRAFTGWIAGLNAAPLILLYPLLLVIVGRGAITVIVLGVLGALPPILLKTREAFAGIPPVLLAVGRGFNLTPSQQFRLIHLPAAVPVMASGVRMGTFYAVTTVIGAEFLTGVGGLGALVPDLADRYDLPAMYGAMAFIVIASGVFLSLVKRLESWLRPR
jgi:NitT/TauT family transport system permease protein